MAKYAKSEAQDWAWQNLRGHWSTLMTPFTLEDEVDEVALRNNIQHIRKLGTQGAGCTWGMGEFWSLTQAERLRVYDIVSDEARGGWLTGAHVTHNSVKEMLSLAHHAEGVGFDLLIVTAPSVVAKTEEQVIEYVRFLAEHTNLAIMFYNTAQFGLVMSPQGLKRLCAIPNVVGVKEASFNQQISIETHLLIGRDAIISTPDEWIFWKGKELGFIQQVMFANTSDWRFDTIEANHYVQFIDQATRGDLNEISYDSNIRPMKALSDKWWGYTMKKFGGALPTPLCKYWGEVMGLSHGLVRQPFTELTYAEKDQIKGEILALLPSINTERKTDEKVLMPGSFSYSNSPKTRLEWLHSPVSNSGMMLMVSVQNLDEALEAEKGGADVVDVKNLQEAMVGSGHPRVVQEVRAGIPAEKHVSVTLGVVPSQPGTVAMAAYAAAQLNATSVKIGFVKTDYDVAVEVLRESRRAMQGSDTKLIGSLFADNHLYGGLDPNLMIKLAKDGLCDGFLIDTLVKDGRNLFDFIPERKLRELVLEGKQLGMSTSLSGHLRLEDMDELARINPDIVGVRGAVCASGDRNRTVAWESVAHFKEELARRKSGEVDVHSSERTGTKVELTSGWVVIDGRGKSCAGVIAALNQQMELDPYSLTEAILADALNIYDVIVWAEQAGHRLVTQRRELDGTVRVLIQP
jgi:uncharacterized protein (UPF0264 family)/dihydrodipicolinate synthase/N-acetylneuraminate lyase